MRGRRVAEALCTNADYSVMARGSIYTNVGDAYVRSGRRPFALSVSDRLHHCYLVGQTGVGKTTLLGTLMKQDVARGIGSCLLDPHGDLAVELAGELGEQAMYWDLADPESPYGYNPLTAVSPQYRPLVASGIIETLKQQWADAWGVRMEHLLRYTLLALLELPKATLADILPLYFDKERRAALLPELRDEQVRQFWQVEYTALRYHATNDGVAPIANKLGAFLAHPLLRRALCAPAEPLRFRRIMDGGKCLLVNLSTGRLGADATNVLGGLLLSGIAHAGLSRAALPMDRRRPFLVYVDEFPAFTSLALASMLPQLRKYGVGLTLAHQYLEQLERPHMAAILGNVGNLFIFRVGAEDAPLLATQLGRVSPQDLVGLQNHECFAKVMIDGTQSKPFTVFTRMVGTG